MVPRPLALDEELRICAENGDPFDLTEKAEAEGHEGGCSSGGSDSDSMAEDSRLLGGGRGGGAPAWAPIPRITKVAVALTLAACVGLFWKSQRSSLAQAAPAGVRGLKEDSKEMKEMVDIAVACSSHPKCVNAGKTTGNCCPNPQGELDLCCDVGNMTQPPDVPFKQLYSTLSTDDSGRQYVRMLACGHMLCNEYAHCCKNKDGNGICAAASDKCCGLVACGETATCCGGTCLASITPCLIHQGSGVTVD
jgi:hypothetical protein